MPLKVTLGVVGLSEDSASAGKQLVNDLDLSVTGPDGSTVYHGNQFEERPAFRHKSPRASRLGFDRINNVEVVEINPPTTGTIVVVVNGYNVPSASAPVSPGPQPFALVVEGGGVSAATCEYSLSSSSAEFPASANTGSLST